MDESGVTFTVVVIAFSRREFLADALNSVIHQDFPVERRKIVVVRNFDGPLARDVDGQPILDIHPARNETGVYAEAAAAAAGGDVIAYLDDDDIWEPTKLRWLADRFDADPTLGFVRNGIRFIDRQGAPLQKELGVEDRRVWQATEGRRWHASQIDLNNPSHRDLVLALPGNNSSVAVRRTVIEPLREYLRQVAIMIDSFSFYAAMAANRGVLVDPSSAETQVRIHGAHVSHATADSFEQFHARYATAMAHFAHDWAIVGQMLSDLGRADLLAASSAERRKLDYFVELATRGSRRRIARLLQEERRSPFHAPGRWRASARLALLSPSLSLRLSYREEQRRWRQESRALSSTASG